VSKSATGGLLHRFHLSDTAAVGAASFVGGAMASLSSQLVVVPIDVVAQRLMLLGGGPAGGSASVGVGPTARAAAAAAAAEAQHTTGFHLARQIVRQEGVRGLYRGLGASVATFVPNSAIWWGSYGMWQQVLWHQVDLLRGHHLHSEGEILGVQTAAGVLTGCTSAVLTNPLDVVKTRLQTAGAAGSAAAPAPAAAAAAESAAAGGAAETAAASAAVQRHSWSQVAAQLLRQEGAAGFFRGVAPRMASSSIWGTAMVTSYEWLKRLCSLPPEAVPA
jgi:solute carrier family 25 protein 44